MKKLIVYILLLILAGIFSGCATLSKNECLQADWYQLGYRDGSRGAPRSLFQKHYDACLEHAVYADRAVYFNGREEGLSIYCTYDSGFNHGRAGNRYQHVCPPDLESGFMAGYRSGQEIYQYESQLASLEHRLRSIESQIQSKEKQLVTPDLSYNTRRKIRADIRYLDLEYSDVIRELRYLEKMKPAVQ
jgi:hypothetical protein